MARTLAALAALTALAMGFQAVRDHAALIRYGYEVSSLERKRDGLEAEAARLRERVSRLSSPPALAAQARRLGLRAEYPRAYPVVRIEPDRGAAAVVVKGD